MKAKIYRVDIGVHSSLVYALTTAGAKRDATEALAKDATARLATGEEIHANGKQGGEILNEEKYRRVVDPNQQDLPLAGDAGPEP